MAYVANSFSIAGTSGTSLTLTYEAQNNDFMFLMCSYQYGTAPATPSGWTVLSYTSVVGTGSGNQIWYRRATASEPTTVTVTTSPFAGRHGLQMVVCRGVDTTTAFDVTPTSRSSGAAATVSSPAITPVTANSLILYLNIPNDRAMIPTPGPIEIARSGADVVYGDINSYYTYSKGASVTVAAQDFYSEANSNINPTCVTVALRDDGNNKRKGFSDIANPYAQILHLLGINGETGHLTGTAKVDVSSTITTLQGKTTTNNTGTGGADLEDGFSAAGYSTTFTTQACAIQGTSVTSAYDLETEIISFTSFGDKTHYGSFGDLSKHFGVGDGTNFRMWRVDAIDTTPSGAELPIACVMEIDGGFEDSEFGTVNSTVLQSLDHFVMAGPANATYSSNSFGFCYQLNDMVLIGGSSDLPLDMNTGVEIARTSSLRTISSQSGQSNTQFFCAHKVQIGNGTDTTYWESQQHSLEWPSASSTADRRVQTQVSAGKFGFVIDASANDTIDFSTTTFNLGNNHVWELASGTSTSATYSENGALIINADVTLNDIGRAMGGITFSGCKEITKNSADLSGGCTISNCTDTTAVTVTSEALFEDLHNCTFSGNNRAITITGNQSGSWSEPSLTVSGNTFDIEYTGATDFSIQSAATLSVNNTGAGTLTVITPVTSFAVTSNIASSDIKIFTANTQTIEASTTGTTINTENAGTYDWTVQKAGYIPQRGTGVVLGSSSVTVDVTLVEDPVYSASHGLTFTTDYSYDANTRIMTIVANQEGRDLYSALIDDFISETALRNCPFPLVAVGPDRIDFKAVGYFNSAVTVGATIDSGDIQFWKGAGMEWEDDTSGNPVKKFYSIKSANTLQSGSVVGYTQVNNGTATETTLVSDKVNEVIQYYEDTNGDGTPDFNYTGHLLFKGFNTGYYQARWDVINDSGVTSLEPYEYTINLLQDAIAGTTGDQSITITTLTDHTGAPITVGGKSFDYELVDPGTNTAEDLLAQHNYNVFNAVDTLISGTLYTSYNAFDLPDLIIEAGSNYETEYGYFEGDGAVTDLSGVYLSRSTADHPDISRFQSNDGTYYTPAVTANITITGMPTAGGSIRLQIYNDTAKTASAWAATTAYSAGDKVLRSTGVGSEQTAGLYMVCTTAGTSGGTEPIWDTTVGNTTADGTATWTTYAILYYDADPASSGYSDSYIDGEEFSSGDTYRIRFAELNGSTSFKTYETTGLTTASGFTVAVSTTADSVYATNALDGSGTTITNKFTADYANDQIDLDTNTDFAVTEAFAYYCYELTTSQGMNEFWGGVTAIDPANYRNNTSEVSIYFDETAGFVKQTDSARWFRDDDARPAIDPTTGGNGLEINWRNPVYGYDAGGGGFTASDRATLNATATQSSVNTVDTNVDAILVDTGTTIPATLSTIDGKIDTIDTNVDSILVDTGTTIPAQISALNDFDPVNDTVANVTLVATTTTNTDMRGTDGANTTAPDNASITAIKAKTDQLVFTKANEVDVNIQSVNDVTVSGTGADGDEWGPV